MVTPSQMLPPNATPLERAIADTAPRQLLDALADAPRRLKSAPPDAVVPWLASEWFLSDFIGYFPDARALLAAGLPWLKVRGTAAAVKQALSWIGMTATLEEDGARLQLDPGNPFAPDNLAAIKHLVGASIPAHVQLYRLFHGYDRRVLHASTGDRWSEAFLSDDSGVWIDGVKLSFGRTQRLEAERPETVGAMRLYRLHTSRTLYPDVLRYGTARFGDAPVLNHPVARGRLTGLGNALGLLHPVILAGNAPPKRWTGGWDARTWGRWLPMKPHRRIARAAFGLSEDWRLGEPNTRFGGYTETATNRFFWSDPDSKLSAFDPGRIRTPIEEVWVVTHGLAAVAPPDLGQMGGRTSRHGLHTSLADWRGQVRMDGSLRWSDAPLTESTGELAIGRLHTGSTVGIGDRASRYPWAGGWDDRRWGGDIGTTHQTLTS